MNTDLIHALIVGGAFVAILGISELWSRRWRGSPEATRKLVHFGGGLICLTFPWLFSSPWYVLGLAVSNSAIIIVGRRTGLLRCLHGVTRTTYGGEYYPVAILLVFVMSYGQPWLYVSSVLVLALADSLAALIGTRYGHLKYNVEDTDKSVEGSAAFLVVAFLATYGPMALLTELPQMTCVMSALLVSVLVTGFEAISLSGTDNLFVPIGVCAILSRVTERTAGQLLYQSGSLVILAAFVAGISWRVKSLNVGGAIAFLLFAYGAWTLGSELWVQPIVIGFLGYIATRALFRLDKDEANAKVRTTFKAVLVPFMLLVMGNSLNMADVMFAPFVAACVVVLSISMWTHMRQWKRMSVGHRLLGATISAVLSALLIAIPPWILGSGRRVVDLVICVGLAVVVTLLHDLATGREVREGGVWCGAQVGLCAVTAVAMVLLQACGVIDPWLI